MNANSNFAEAADCLCLASRRAARVITRAYDRQLRPHGIRATQFSILVNLSLRGALTIGALAEVLGIERTTLTRNLALIESNGWVKIRTGEDPRSREIEIAPKGKAMLEQAFPSWRVAQTSMQSTIGETGAAALRRLSHSR